MILDLVPKSDESWLFAEFELTHLGTPVARFYLFKRHPLYPDGGPPAQKTTPYNRAIGGKWARPLEAKFSTTSISVVKDFLDNLGCNTDRLVETALKLGWSKEHIYDS